MISPKIKIAVFASGSGSNAEEIFKKFLNHPRIEVSVLYANKADAYALIRAKKYNIDTEIFNREQFYKDNTIINSLKDHNIDWIVLAGFLWLIPEALIDALDGKIVNIHPAMLPKYGGKGMYGINVHKAVVEAREKETGITIHFVTKKYDEGQIIFQATCAISPNDTPEQVANKVLQLEHLHYPCVIENVILK